MPLLLLLLLMLAPRKLATSTRRQPENIFII